MTLSIVLDVGIGLAFTYFLLCLIASGIQEVIAGIFTWRGTYLAKGIDVILDNNAQASFAWGGVANWLKAHLTPSALPSAAAAAIDPKTATDGESKLKKILDMRYHPLMKSSPSDVPSYVSSRNFASALLETLRDGSKAPLFTQAERTVAALPAGDLKRTLSQFLEDAGGDFEKFRSSLEDWFDDAMDRLSGIYKRLSQYVMLILGVLLAVSLNVDSMRVARVLWETPALRSAMVADAEKAPAPTTPTPAPTDPQLGAIATQVQQFQGLDLPIGWPIDPVTNEIIWKQITWWTVAGWLMTAAAVGLGAPFWFGLLQSLTNMRNAGPSPGKS
jgi:hypothetical protein